MSSGGPELLTEYFLHSETMWYLLPFTHSTFDLGFLGGNHQLYRAFDAGGRLGRWPGQLV